MEISFVPESDNSKVLEAVKNYRDIWRNYGQEIISSIEKITGLKFKQNVLEAKIVDSPHGRSHPLTLSSYGNYRGMRWHLIHELGHIIIDDNEIEVKASKDENLSFLQHKLLYLMLFDVYIDFYKDKEIVESHIDFERQKNPEYYSQAWEWALSMRPEERQKLFAKVRETKRFP